MEKHIDSEYQNDLPKSPESWTIALKDNANDGQQKIKSEAAEKVPRARRKIARKSRPMGKTDPGKAKVNKKTDKLLKEETKRVRKLSVLKNKLVTGRRSVQNNTKTLHRIVPDRIGKYINSSVRREAKLIGHKSVANHSKDGSPGSGANSEKRSDMLKDCSETKFFRAKRECLSKNESATVDSRIGSESGTENIFEKIFDDSLGSTSVVNDASSREILNVEADKDSACVNSEKFEKYSPPLEKVENFEKEDARMIENEKTPVKDDRSRPPSPETPVKKTKDHDNYYNRNKIRHVCGYCHKIFKSNGKLNSHVYSHTGERPFDCNNCGKAFSSKFKLVRHLLIHSEVRKFVCQICDRTFLRNDHLKNHYKIHDPQKKMYRCTKENCDKEYSSLMSHKKHMAYHSVEDGNLKCLICGVKFETKDEILFHLKSHSGSRLFKTQSDKKFKCDFCDRLFLTRKDVNRHLVVHTGKRDFLCQFCPQRFGRKDHLVRHIKKSHLNDDISLKREVTGGLIERKERVPKRKHPPSATATFRSKPKEQEEKRPHEQPQPQQQQQQQQQQQEQLLLELEPQAEPELQLQSLLQSQQQQQQQEQLLLELEPQAEPELQLQSLLQSQQQQQQQEQLLLELEPQAEPEPESQQSQPEQQQQQQEQQQEPNQEEDEEVEEDEEGDEDEDQNTHIVITVKSPIQKKKFKSDSNTKSKPFQKDPSVPKKKQVPLSKNKNSTTQIFLQNIPNIFIIPNNSIILLKNQGSSSKAKKTGESESRNSGGNPEVNTSVETSPVYTNQDRFEFPEDMVSKEIPNPGDANTLMESDNNVTYNCNMFQQPQFENNFPFVVDNLENLPDLTGFDQQSENLNFEMIAPSELLKKNDMPVNAGEMNNVESLSQVDLQRKVGVVKPITKNITDEVANELLEGGSASLTVSESLLNDFKVDDSIILDNDGGLLNNIFGQSGVEPTGNEFLRSLLMNDNPALLPLPGFSQIFNHNAN